MKHLLLGGLLLVAVVVTAVVIGRADRAAQASPGDTVADLVYGQFGSFTTGNQNCYYNTSINTNSLCAPNGITIDSAGRLWIADTLNHRVLEYDTPLSSTTANRVFGQGGSFTTGIANNGGVSATSLDSPTGVAVDSAGRLYIADDGNHRVLEYNTPLTSAAANRVFGQFNSFTTNVNNNGGTSANSLWNPFDVAVDSNDNLYVSDRYNYRVLEYNAPVANDTTADTVFGQLGSMTTNVLNKGGLSADSLGPLAGIGIDSQDNLYVADDQNNRVLVYDKPLNTDTTADFVFGQFGSFTSGLANNGGISASSIYAPRDIAVDIAGNVYIAETGNERTLEYDNAFNTDDVADRVFGQGGSFTTGTNNSIGLNASSQADPWSVTIDPACHLWVADLGNNRALEYDGAPPGCTVQPTFTPTSTVCPIGVCTATPTPTITNTPTMTPTPTPTCVSATQPPMPCSTPTPTCIPVLPCPTDTPTATPTCTPGAGVVCPTDTPTLTPTDTAIPTETSAPTNTTTNTPTPTSTPTKTPTSTKTPPVLGTVIAVSPANPHGWAFAQEVPNATGGFSHGPAAPPLGAGSAHMTLDATGREILGTLAYGTTRLADINTLTYSTYQNPLSTASSSEAITLQLEMDYDLTDANVAYQGRLVFQPGAGVVKGLWQTWDALAGTWWATGMPGSAVCPQSSPCTWSHVMASFPNAGVGAARGVLFRAGGPAPGFDGNVDAFSISVAGAETTYDFEQTCMEDLNSDGSVTFADLLLLAQAYNATPVSPNWNVAADFDANARVGFPDLLLLATHYNQRPCVP